MTEVLITADVYTIWIKCKNTRFDRNELNTKIKRRVTTENRASVFSDFYSPFIVFIVVKLHVPKMDRRRICRN